jgi:hypothetical protein
VSIVDQLNSLWNQILEFLGKLVIPDWGSLVGLLPIFLVVGVLGPLLSLLALVWFIYLVRKPRSRLTVLEGPREASLDESGRPVYPPGYPYCARDGLIYPSGTTVCEHCHDELVVTCPKCGIGRQARYDTCANCGLILKIDKSAQVRTLAPTGPPPGGAAAA